MSRTMWRMVMWVLWFWAAESLVMDGIYLYSKLANWTLEDPRPPAYALLLLTGGLVAKDRADRTDPTRKG